MPLTGSRSSASAAGSVVLLSLLSFGNLANAVPRVGESYSHVILKRGPTYNGCYSSSDPLSQQTPYKWQTPSWCAGVCAQSQSAVFAVSDGSNCWCGDELPASDTLVDDSNCDVGCDGYGKIMCGGLGFFSVYLNGTATDVQNFNGDSSSSSSSSPSTKSSPSSTTTSGPTVITSVAPGRTVVVTEPASQTTSHSASTSKSSGGGGSSKTAAVAAGVVVGVVALAGIIGAGMYFILRQRRRRQAEEEYRQRSQVDFMRGIERNGSLTFSNASDSRMDPDAGRRNSVGSLADNRDYSRRILRVANPDSS